MKKSLVLFLITATAVSFMFSFNRTDSLLDFRTGEERKVQDAVLEYLDLPDTTRTTSTKGQESTEKWIDYKRGRECAPDSLLMEYVVVMEKDFAEANGNFNDSLKLFTYYFFSKHSEKQAKVLLSHCGFSTDFSLAVLYFEKWEPYVIIEDVEVTAGQGGYAFLSRQGREWRVDKTLYVWTAN